MASRKIKDLVATIGEYKAQDGEIKKRYLKCGAMFENDEGNQSIKIDGLPVGADWSGWLSLYDPREFNKDSPKTNAPAIDAGPSAQRNIEQVGLRQDDDVPF